MYEVVAMVKQLGIPTWFMTLSCADLRWPELFQIIGRTQGLDLTEEEIETLSYNERCSMLNLNPVVVAKHFQYRVETFFTEAVFSKPAVGRRIQRQLFNLRRLLSLGSISKGPSVHVQFGPCNSF